MFFYRHTHFGHHREHLGADVLSAVDGWHGEIAALGARPMSEVAHLVFGAGVGGQLGAVEPEAGVVGIDVIAHVVEDEELGLGAEHHHIADTSLLEVGLGTLGNRARIAFVHLAGGGLKHVAEHRHGGLGKERVDMRAGRVGHQRHVGSLDSLPAGNRGAIEGISFREHRLVHARAVRGDMLHLPLGVREAQVKELHFLVLHHLEHFANGLRSLCHFLPLSSLATSCTADVYALPLALAQMASLPVSPVRMRIASSTVETKILPSPIRPVLAAFWMASSALGSISSPSTTSSFTLGRKSTTYSAPR